MAGEKIFDIDCMKYRKSTHLASVDVDALIGNGSALHAAWAVFLNHPQSQRAPLRGKQEAVLLSMQRRNLIVSHLRKPVA